jgi:hypothetical protein
MRAKIRKLSPLLFFLQVKDSAQDNRTTIG